MKLICMWTKILGELNEFKCFGVSEKDLLKSYEVAECVLNNLMVFKRI